MTVND